MCPVAYTYEAARRHVSGHSINRAALQLSKPTKEREPAGTRVSAGDHAKIHMHEYRDVRRVTV
jgi:hypothetical protein